MPVSPQDFAIWSNLTGNPYPKTPAERMALAPEVYQFNRNLASGRNPATQQTTIGSAIDTAGRWALGIGLMAGAGLLAGKYLGGKKSEKGETKGTQTDSGVVGEPSLPTGPEQTPPPTPGSPESPKPSPKEFLSATTGSSSKSVKPTEITETVRSQQPYGYRSDRRMRNLVEGEPDVIEEAIYAPTLTRGELTGIAPTELTEAPIRMTNPMAGGETYRPSGESSNEISLALAKARAKITDKTVGKGLIAPRETPVSYSEAEKEEAYSNVEEYSPYNVGRSHEPVSSRVEEYLGKAVPTPKKLELDDEPEVVVSTPTVSSRPDSQVAQASTDITPPTTAQRYQQNVVPDQTTAAQIIRGQSPIKPITTPIEAKPVSQSAVISGQQSFSPGSEPEMVGEDAAQKAAAFRKSASYAAMQKQYPELQPIESSPEPASAAPVSLTNVQPSPQVRVAREIKAPVESPIALMAKPAQAPVTASVTPTAPSGASPAEVRELDTLLSRALARHTPEQRAAIRDQMLAEKYGGGGAKPIVTPSQPEPVRVAHETIEAPIEMPSPVSGPSPESVRFAREAARGMSRVGLMAQREAGRASVASRAEFGPEAKMDAPGESRELADPSVLRAMAQRQPSMTVPRYF